MNGYTPIGTGYQGIPTLGRVKEVQTIKRGQHLIERVVNARDRSTGKLLPMQQIAGRQGSALDAQQANGPARYMGGNAASAIAASEAQTKAAAPASAAPSPAGSGEYDATGIGWKQFHDAFTSRGSLGPDNKYTAGPLAGMNESQAKAWTQSEWQRHGAAGTQSTMVQKLATVYGTRKESPAMGSPAAPTSPQSQKPVMAPASQPSVAASPAGPTPSPALGGEQRSSPETMPGAQILQKMGIQPASPSVQAPESGVRRTLPMPRRNNDPALTKRIREQGGDAKATVWQNGKPWRPGMTT